MCETGRYIMTLFILLIFSIVCDSYTEETPFPREFDFRYTSYQELLDNSKQFQIFHSNDIVGFVKLTTDIPRDQLLVGTRGALFRLGLDDLNEIESTEWKADNDTKDICRKIGQREDDCYNFIKVLLVHEESESILTCGTFAFKPVCTWRKAENLSEIIEQRDGVGFCPFSPHHNSTGVVTSKRNYISATVLDVTERVPVIYRIYGNKPLLRTPPYSKWLNDPDFVSSYEIGDFVYFFFREAAVEYINCGKRKYSRVGRICKSDKGGNFLLENNWTTFFKARMNCSIPGDYPFYFDEVQSTFLLEKGNETLLYGIFTTPVNSLAGSAVCVYNLTSFTNTFIGPFKYQENARSAWERHNNPDPLLKCPADTTTNKRSKDDSDLKLDAQQMLTAQKYQMMDLAVQPVTVQPLAVGRTERWSHVVADLVQGKNDIYHVIFVATEDGNVKKMVHLPELKAPCLVEEIRVVPNGEHKPIKEMTISKQHEALYISTHENIIRVPLHRCGRFTDSDMCMNSMDPYCGWDETESKCISAPKGDPLMFFWSQAMNSCPIVEHPVDGGWSSWSAWNRCQQAGDDPSAGDCWCRTRSCDSPAPLYGGMKCEGGGIEVANCTVHGQWSEWSKWSSCSVTCGPNGTQTRTRQCSDPPPRFGGQPCIGQDKEEAYCVGNPSCPAPPVDGNWAPWAPWSPCTVKCNRGIQTRRRGCNSPPPSGGGIPCTGNKQEWRMCNSQLCEEKQRSTTWSQWYRMNSTAEGYFQQRYRFICRANVPDPKMIKTSHYKTHTKFCLNRENQCFKPESFLNVSEDGGWSTWSTWSECSTACGAGTKWRGRSCDSPEPKGLGADCEGEAIETKECNVLSCTGEWACWGEYSACSVTCGPGVRTRQRQCSKPKEENLVIPCVGVSEESIDCYMPSCNGTEGWDTWSSWTDCGIDGIQYRNRPCLETNPERGECEGHSVQFQSCVQTDYDVKIQAVMSRKKREFSLFHLTVVASAAFVMGVIVCVGIYLCVKSFKSIRKYDVSKETKNNDFQHYEPRKFGSFASQISFDFIPYNNKIYDSSTLSSRGKAVIYDATFNRNKYKNYQDNGTIRTNTSLRTEV